MHYPFRKYSQTRYFTQNQTFVQKKLKNTIKSTSHSLPEIQISLDSLLENKFERIRNKKRQVLFNLTSQNFQNPLQHAQDFLSNLLKISKNQIDNDLFTIPNDLVLQYINNVYKKYGIKDPSKIQEIIEIEKKKYSTNHQTSIHHSFETPVKNTSKQSDSLKTAKNSQSKTNKKLNLLRQTYRKETSYASKFTQQANRQIGYRTKQKINFKKQKQTQNHTYSLNNSIKYSENYKRLLFLGSSLQNDQYKSLRRYCPMCEELIIKAEIQQHQKQCFFLQQAFQMTYQQILDIINDKIVRIKNYLSQNLIEKSQQMAIKQFSKLKQTVGNWLINSTDLCSLESIERQTFSSIKKHFEEYSLNAFEAVSKLRWFTILKQQIIKQIVLTR